MKKIIALASGSFLVVACLITPLSKASSLAYHNYLFDRHLTKNDKRFSQGRRTQKLSRLPESFTERKSAIRNLRYPVTGKRDFYAGSSNFSRDKEKMLRGGLYFDEKSVSPNNRKGKSWAFSQRNGVPDLAVSGRVQVGKKLETYDNQDYTIQFPSSLEKYGDTFYSRRLGLQFSVKHIDNCEGLGFSSCAINASKNENHVTARNKISNISRIKRQRGMSDSVLNEISLKTPTFTETFEGIYLGEERFISRHFVGDGKGGMYLIDAQTKKENSGRDLDTIKKVFDSFRII